MAKADVANEPNEPGELEADETNKAILADEVDKANGANEVSMANEAYDTDKAIVANKAEAKEVIVADEAIMDDKANNGSVAKADDLNELDEADASNKANDADNSNEADEANVADVDMAATENIKADETDVANKPDEAHKAKTNEANGAILTNKALEAIEVDDISLTKYYLLSELYFGIWGHNNPLGADKAIELEKLDEANQPIIWHWWFDEDGFVEAAVNASIANIAIPDKSIATILYSLIKYSAILLKEKIYFEIFCGRNNQLRLDLAIVVDKAISMANMDDELDVAEGRNELKEPVVVKGQVLARGRTRGKVVAKGRARGHVVARGHARGKVVAKGWARGHVVARGRARGNVVAKCQARGHVVARSRTGAEFMARGRARVKVLSRGRAKG